VRSVSFFVREILNPSTVSYFGGVSALLKDPELTRAERIINTTIHKLHISHLVNLHVNHNPK
jgi:hypothetical protein